MAILKRTLPAALAIAVGLFVLGLIGTHIVTFATRGSRRDGKPMKKSLTILMWASPLLALVGLILGVIWFILRS